MTTVAVRRDSFSEQQMAALELRYRRAQDALREARALEAAFGARAGADDPEARRVGARVQHLQAQLADLEVAMEMLEERQRA